MSNFGIVERLGVEYQNHEYVLIDTSVYESNNFIEGTRIKQLFKLSEERYITIVMPEIVKWEVHKHIRQKVSDATKKLKKMRNDVRILRNSDFYSDAIFKSDSETVGQSIVDGFDAICNSSGIITLECGSMDVRSIFIDYFDEKPPFNSQNKKSEFPDAFILKLVKDWCQESKNVCVILSNDSDQTAYESSEIVQVQSYQEYLDRKLKDVDAHQSGNQGRVTDFMSAITNATQTLKVELKQWVKAQIEEPYKYFADFDGREIHDISINRVNVEVEPDNFLVIRADEDTAEAEMNCKASFSVDVIVDDIETLTKDYDTKSWFYYGTTTVEFIQDVMFPVQVTYEFGNQYHTESLMITNINEGNILEW
jgi:hypothetical protein